MKGTEELGYRREIEREYETQELLLIRIRREEREQQA
jgi:hypothetical protein